MKCAAKPLALSLLLLSALSLVAQVGVWRPVFPAEWGTAPPPSETSVFACANYSGHEWAVERSSNITVFDSAIEKRPGAALPPGFTRTNEMRGSAVVQKVSNGWLVGFSAGEFGGGLWWADGARHHTRKLSAENVSALLPRGGEVLVFTGIAHLTLDKGKVYVYSVSNPGALSLVADIGSEPSASTLARDGSVFVVTHKGLLRLTSENRVELLYRNRAMGFLYPNSIVEDAAGAIVIGMRFYVLRLVPDGAMYKALWYMPSACTKTRVKDYHCECIGK